MVGKASDMSDPSSHRAANSPDVAVHGPAGTEATRLVVLLSLMLLIAYICAHNAVAQSAPSATEMKPARKDAHHLAPTLATEELVIKAVKARQAGLDFLVNTQNKDGSWGSHDPVIANLKDFGFSTSNPGSNDGVRANVCYQQHQ